jgi:CHAT domain-containing protein
VASFFGTTPLFGTAAKASALRARGGDYTILHLMGHVDNDTHNPEFSRFVFAADGRDDRNIDVHEVLGLDLHKANLVVLSGCQSQKGKRTRGDDVTALSRAFMYAGAPSVVASLWNVDDDATKQLMIAFYSHLRDGLSKAEALRAAQRDVRLRYPHPYYWASFVLMGDPGSAREINMATIAKP